MLCADNPFVRWRSWHGLPPRVSCCGRAAPSRARPRSS
jgi:hypothetical protein